MRLGSWSLLAGGEEPLRAAAEPRVIWRSSDGAVVASAGPEGSHWAVEVPECGLYVLEGGGRVVAYPFGDATLETVGVVFARLVVPFAAHLAGAHLLHASAVVLGGRVVVLCGPARSGKSTVAYALARAGHELWADDAVAWRRDGARLLAEPLPFVSSLREDAAEHFGVDSAPPPGIANGGAPLPLAATVVLERRDEPAGIRLRAIAPAEATTLLLPQVYRYREGDRAEHERCVTACLDLVETAPVLGLALEGLEKLDEAIGALEHALLPLDPETRALRPA